MLRRHLVTLALALIVGGCGESKRTAAPPAASAPPAENLPLMVTPPGQVPTGREAFLSIGGVTGFPEAAVQAALVAGYQRAGFRVHYIVAAMSFAPFQAKLGAVAQEYLLARRELKQVVFHHTGHGWDDHISYQDARGGGGSTLHRAIADNLGAPFPTSEPLFAATRFGLVYDACGQGRATAQTVPARAGFVATATPDAAPAAACTANQCAYACVACRDQFVAAYQYSQAFGAALAPPPNEAGMEAVMRAAHAAGQAALQAAGSPSGCNGKFQPF
jgi:hypothetical protein